jgi:hypothetical protein
MVGIDEVLLGGLALLVGSSLVTKPRDSYTLTKSPITEPFYKARQAVNFEALEEIQGAQDKLEDIRAQTLQQERYKTDTKIDYLTTEKQKAGAYQSELQKLIDIGYGQETYSPRVRGKIMNKYGYDPVDYEAIERGKQAKEQYPLTTEFITGIDQKIISLNKSYSDLESI